MSRPRGILAAGTSAALLIAQQVAGRAVRDALFLTSFDATDLPFVMLICAALSLFGAFFIGRIMPTIGPRSTAVVLALASAALFCAEALLFSHAPTVVAVMTYIHVSVLGALTVSTFWSSFNERFDPHTAKENVALVTSGAALGGVIGGASMHLIADVVELPTTLWTLAAVSFCAALAVWNVGRATQRENVVDVAPETGAVGTLRSDRYLRRIAFTVALLGAASVLVDFALKVEAERKFTGSAELLSFFAAFYTAAAVLTFVLQAGLARPLLKHWGLTRAIASLPIAVGVITAVAAVAPRLWSTAVAHIARSSLANSFFRSGYELLYTPVAPSKKRRTKTFIDVACDQIGDGAGSVIVLIAIAVSASLVTHVSLGTAALLYAVVLWHLAALHRGYVEQLAESLRAGVVALEDPAALDATTLKTFADTTQALDRHTLLTGIETIKKQQAALRSPSADNAELLVAQLGDAVHGKEASAALVSLGNEAVDALAMGLQDADLEERVRRRIPKVLRKLRDPRAAEALLGGLSDDVFRVRRRCAQAYSALRREGIAPAAPKSRVYSAIWEEIDAGKEKKSEPDPHHELDDAIDMLEVQADAVDKLLSRQKSREVEQVFLLLSLSLDRSAIADTLTAVTSDDQATRGTALEYLDNVLPAQVKERLAAYLDQIADG